MSFNNNSSNPANCNQPQNQFTTISSHQNQSLLQSSSKKSKDSKLSNSELKQLRSEITKKLKIDSQPKHSKNSNTLQQSLTLQSAHSQKMSMNMSVLNQFSGAQLPQNQVSSGKKTGKGQLQKLPPQIPQNQVSGQVLSKMYSSQTQASIEINSPKNKLKALLLGTQSASSSTNLQKLLAMSQQYPSIQALNFNQTQRSNAFNMSQDSCQDIKSLTQLQNFANNASGQGEKVYKGSLLGETSKSANSLKLKLKIRDPFKGSFQEQLLDQQKPFNIATTQSKKGNIQNSSQKKLKLPAKPNLPSNISQSQFSLSQRLQNLASFSNQPSNIAQASSGSKKNSTSKNKIQQWENDHQKNPFHLAEGFISDNQSSMALLEEQLKTSVKKRNSHLNQVSHPHFVETVDRQPRYSHAHVNEDQIVLTSLKKKANVKKYSSHSPSSLEKIQLKKFLVTQGLNPSAQLLKKYTSESPIQGSVGSQSKNIKSSLHKSGIKRKDLTMLGSLLQLKQQLNFQNERDQIIKTAYSVSGLQNHESAREEYITNLNFPTSQSSKIKGQKKKGSHKNSQDSIQEELLSGKSKQPENDRTIQQEGAQGFDILSDSTNGMLPQNRSLENFNQAMTQKMKPPSHSQHLSLAFYHKSPPEQKYHEQLFKIPKIHVKQKNTVKVKDSEAKRKPSINSKQSLHSKSKESKKLSIYNQNSEHVLEQVIFENSELRERLEKLESQVTEVKDLRQKLDEKDRLILQLQQSMVHMTTQQSAQLQQNQQNFNMSLNLSSLQQSKASPSMIYHKQNDTFVANKQGYAQPKLASSNKNKQDKDINLQGIVSFSSQDPNNQSKLIEIFKDEKKSANLKEDRQNLSLIKSKNASIKDVPNRLSKITMNSQTSKNQNAAQSSDISNQFTFNYEQSRQMIAESPLQLKLPDQLRSQQESSGLNQVKLGLNENQRELVQILNNDSQTPESGEVTDNSPDKILSDDQIDFENLFSNLQLSAGKQRPSRGMGVTTSGHVQRITNLQDYVDYGSTDNLIAAQENEIQQNGIYNNAAGT